MDFMGTERKLSKVSADLRKLTRRYAELRNQYGTANYNLHILLIPCQKEDRYRKASFDKQLIMLMADTPENHKTEVYKYVEDFIKCREQYKGYDKMIEERRDEISWTQSMLRYAREND